MKNFKSYLSLALVCAALVLSPASYAQTADQGKVAGATPDKISVNPAPKSGEETRAVVAEKSEATSTSNGTEDNSAPGSRGVPREGGNPKSLGSSAANSTTADITDFEGSGKDWLIGIAIVATILTSLALFGRIKEEHHEDGANTLSH